MTLTDLIYGPQTGKHISVFRRILSILKLRFSGMRTRNSASPASPCPHSLFLSGFMGSLPEPGKQVTMSRRHYVLPVQWMLSSGCCSSPHSHLLAEPWLPCSVMCSSLESSQLPGRGQGDPITESTVQKSSFSSQKKGHEKAVWATEQDKQAHTHTHKQTT